MRSYPTIEALLQVKQDINRAIEGEEVPFFKASQENPWFTKPQIIHRLHCIANGLLDETTMKSYVDS